MLVVHLKLGRGQDPVSSYDPDMGGLRSHFREIDNLSTLHKVISKRLIESAQKIHRRVCRSILNKL